MNFTNVRLILVREIRDQLRDRRTLFMIFVLPMLLYPLLGTAYFQMFQFQTRKAMTVLVVGSGQLASAPTPLIADDRFAPRLFPDGEEGAKLLTLEMAPRRRHPTAMRPATGSPRPADWWNPRKWTRPWSSRPISLNDWRPIERPSMTTRLRSPHPLRLSRRAEARSHRPLPLSRKAETRSPHPLPLSR